MSTHLVGDVIAAEISDYSINQSDHYPIIITFSKFNYDSVPTDNRKNISIGTVSKIRWDHGDVLSYYELTRQGVECILSKYGDLLDADYLPCSDVLLSSLVADIHSDNSFETNVSTVDVVYTDLINVLKSAERRTIPALQVNALKFWWDQELDVLKQEAFQADKDWKSVNCPKAGQAFDKFKDAKYKFKLAIRQKRERDSDDFTDSLYESLLKKNNNFWKIWRNKFNKRHSLPSNISDLTNPAEIADGFGNYFSSVCFPNSDTANHAETGQIATSSRL